MGLFGFGKKKDAGEKPVPCACGGMCTTSEIAAKKTAEDAEKTCGYGGCDCGGLAEKPKAGRAAVKVLGSGCAKCNALEEAAVEALRQLGMDATIEHVTDFGQIAAYGVMTTPALVVDGQVVSFGKVLKTEEVVKLLKKICA